MQYSDLRRCRPAFEKFCQRYEGFLGDSRQRQFLRPYLLGLLGPLERKSIEPIALEQEIPMRPLQYFIGASPWDERPMLAEHRRHVCETLGSENGVLILDPTSFPKRGEHSVGVARQWCGRLGKVDHGPGAISLGDVSAHGPPLGDLRLSLPTAWTQEKARRPKAGGPKAHRGSRTRHQLAGEMLEKNGPGLPPAWRAGDDERGRPYGLRRRLAGVGERSLLAVPSHTLRRELATAPPVSNGRGRQPPRPWHRVEPWSQALSDDAGKRIDVRDGSQGPRVVEVGKRRVVSRTHRRQQGHAALGVVRRSRARDHQQVVQVDDCRSKAAPETPLGQVARVATAAQRSADGRQRSKRAAGLADAAVRHGTGWQQQHTLSLLAPWFVVQETERGKKKAPSDDVPSEAPRHRGDRARGLAVRPASACAGHVPEALATP